MSTDDSDISVENDSSQVTSLTVKKKFSKAQTICLTSYFQSGMSGTGKAHLAIIDKAAKDTGLSPAQVKVKF